MANPKLSIIIPAYKEADNIYATIDEIVKVQSRLEYDFEVIVVVDGSPDKTYEEAKRYKSPKVKVFTYHPNRGKGYAIKFGVAQATGDIITFTDAGGDFKPEQFDKYVKLLELFDADIVIGSKRHPASRVNYPAIRRLYSYVYHKMTRVLFGLRVTDTQAGLKFMKNKVAKDIVPRTMVDQYAFDLELLVIALQLGHRRIFEAPVELQFNSVSSGINVRTIQKMIRDTFSVFYRARILNHYRKQKPNG